MGAKISVNVITFNRVKHRIKSLRSGMKVSSHLATGRRIFGFLNFISKSNGPSTRHVNSGNNISAGRLTTLIGRKTAEVTEISNNVNLSRL